MTSRETLFYSIFPSQYKAITAFFKKYAGYSFLEQYLIRWSIQRGIAELSNSLGDILYTQCSVRTFLC